MYRAHDSAGDCVVALNLLDSCLAHDERFRTLDPLTAVRP
jgi:hypothetical protein